MHEKEEREKWWENKERGRHTIHSHSHADEKDQENVPHVLLLHSMNVMLWIHVLGMIWMQCKMRLWGYQCI